MGGDAQFMSDSAPLTNHTAEDTQMSYKGEHLNNCRAVPFDWNNSSVVIVSG
jgi:hypothetical protein